MRTPTYACANCDAPIVDTPVLVLGHAFCCTGCAAGGPCTCSYDVPAAGMAAAVADPAASAPDRAPAAASVPDRGPAVADRGSTTATASPSAR